MVAVMLLSLVACAPTAPPAATPAPPPSARGSTIFAPGEIVPPTMQYLYGSGEAAALSAQAFGALTRYAAQAVNVRPRDSVILAGGATLDAPRFESCGTKPLAAVFDVDETMILNLGVEEKDGRKAPGPFDSAQWDRWEKTGAVAVAPVPGALDAVTILRKLGIAVIFNSNRSAANAQGTTDAIAAAGLGSAVHGETLFLAGDDVMGTKKDGRRATIAAKYCVIALGGDQLGDFSDLFNAGLPVSARRAATLSGPIARLWGNGWFVLPNPVYGSGLKGGFDDVFPMDKRWADPASEAK